MLAIGLMSGTSVDGVDGALVRIENNKYELLDFITIRYDDEFKKKVKRNLSDETALLSEVCSLNFELGYKFKDCVCELVKRNKLQYSDIEFVASHGQTIWHNPLGLGGNVPSTLQIGTGQIITEETGIKVVTNFRERDIIVGGQGAPLVPKFEYLYFRRDDKNIALQNIGGIGNVTYIAKDASIDDVVAFDTGPGNCIIDYFMNKYYGLDYDESGKVAKSGMIIKPLLDAMLKDSSYIYIEPPKSTGRELFSKERLDKWIKDFDIDKYDKCDVITTVTELTVFSIVYNYQKFLKDIDLVIVSGGGSHNQYIMNRLNEELGCVYSVSEYTKIDNLNDAKEAFAFAILGYLSLNGMPGNVKKATGAKKDVVLGEVTLGAKNVS